MNKYLWTDSEWNFPLLEKTYNAIEDIAINDFKLDVYPNQIEIISAEQMLYAYSSTGMPINYDHWSFGKHFIQYEKNYFRGISALAYEIVINTNPCIAYCMEDNTMTMQALVMAHAAFGHNTFFKNNYLFKQGVAADSIIDYLIFARNYIRNCEEKYGEKKVEELLDSCHALQMFGVDRYKKPKKLSSAQEQARQVERERIRQEQVNDLWKSLPKKNRKLKFKRKGDKLVKEPTENILYFIEKNSPILEPWEREIVRIIRKLAQYFYPQIQTKTINEGTATFYHYNIFQELEKKELITPGAMLEFLSNHTAVVAQAPWYHKYYSGINPYTLGFKMFSKLKQICENPTKEDIYWFKDYANTPWRDTVGFAIKNFRDESFIRQFLAPQTIRELKLFSLQEDAHDDSQYVVKGIHDDDGYKRIREALASSYDINVLLPDVSIVGVNQEDRTLHLKHQGYNGVRLANCKSVLDHIKRLWGFKVILQSYSNDGTLVEFVSTEK